MYPIGIIGLGRWGSKIFHACSRAGLDVVALCDLDSARLGPFPEAICTQDCRETLANPRVRGIVIATPPPSHAPLVLEALQNEKHVFVEKPLALSTSEARAILSAAERVNRRVMVGHILRFHPAVVGLKRWIESAVLGHVRAVLAERVGSSLTPRSESAWWTLATHDLSVTRYLLDVTPLEVSLTGQPDTYHAVLKYAAHSAQLRVSSTWPTKRRRCIVVGEAGVASWNDLGETAELQLWRRSIEPSWGSAAAIEAVSPDVRITMELRSQLLQMELAYWLRVLRDGWDAPSDARDGYEAVRILEAGERSLALGGAFTPLTPWVSDAPVGFDRIC